MPILKPSAWIFLLDYCRTQKLRIEDVLREVIGEQADYEEERKENRITGKNFFLDDYLEFAIEAT